MRERGMKGTEIEESRALKKRAAQVQVWDSPLIGQRRGGGLTAGLNRSELMPHRDHTRDPLHEALSGSSQRSTMIAVGNASQHPKPKKPDAAAGAAATARPPPPRAEAPRASVTGLRSQQSFVCVYVFFSHSVSTVYRLHFRKPSASQQINFSLVIRLAPSPSSLNSTSIIR